MPKQKLRKHFKNKQTKNGFETDSKFHFRMKRETPPLAFLRTDILSKETTFPLKENMDGIKGKKYLQRQPWE